MVAIERNRPRAKTIVEEGTIVLLTIAKAFPIIANVAGETLTKARRILERSGFNVRVTRQVSGQPKDTVISQTPVGVQVGGGRGASGREQLNDSRGSAP